MKIVLIRPSMTSEKASDAMEPLVFALLRWMTPNDIEMEMYDERIESLPEVIEADLIAMTVETFSARRAYQIAEKYRSKGIKVLMGGVHPTMLPDEVQNYSDIVAVGDAENIWYDIINDLKNGTLANRYGKDKYLDIGEICFDRSIFEGKKYGSIRIIQYGRGCKFSCEFCSVHAFYGKSIRYRNVENIIAEIKSINSKYFFFADDNIFANEEKALELFVRLKELKIKWACQISIDIAQNQEILKIMSDSGCMCLLIGFESLEVNNLKQMKKMINVCNIDYDKVIKTIYKYKMMIYGTFVFGYDYDTEKSFKEIMKFVFKNKFFIANFNILIPMPGTNLYKKLQEENKLIYKNWWLEQDFKYGNSIYHPVMISNKQLELGCMKLRFKFNSFFSIIRRCFNVSNIKNLFIYIIVNVVSRREIIRKQGKKIS